jgi:antitoxin CcdA
MRIIHAHREMMMPRQPISKARKQPVNVSVRGDLAEEARAFGTNMSAVLERALEEEHRTRRRENWHAENRKAIEAWNKWIAENGIPFSDLRPW